MILSSIQLSKCLGDSGHYSLPTFHSVVTAQFPIHSTEERVLCDELGFLECNVLRVETDKFARAR